MDQRRQRQQQQPHKLQFNIPPSEVGLVIGAGGSVLAELKRLTACNITLASAHPQSRSKQRQQQLSRIIIEGEGCAQAKAMIEGVVFFQSCGSQQLNIRLLYVDMVSLAEKFFDAKHFSVRPAEVHVANFVRAAQASGVTLVGFFYGIRNRDTRNRRDLRKLAPVRQRRRNLPTNLSEVMSELLVGHGVEVRFCADCNVPEAMAYSAINDGAAVLSLSSKLGRYRGDEMSVFVDFNINAGTGELEVRRPAPRGPRDEREEQLTVPATPPSYVSTTAAWAEREIINTHVYMGGAPSPLIHLMGNPYITARPLRRVYLAQLFAGSADVTEVCELFPNWNPEEANGAGDAYWDSTIVNPHDVDEEGFGVMARQDAKAAYRMLFPEEASGVVPVFPDSTVTKAAWAKHVHACKSLVADLCCNVRNFDFRHRQQGSSSWASFVDMMKAAEDGW